MLEIFISGLKPNNELNLAELDIIGMKCFINSLQFIDVTLNLLQIYMHCLLIFN